MLGTLERISVVDSHTAGEPTRVVVEGFPDLGEGSMALLRERFKNAFDDYRSCVVNEPRGSDVLVGALLCRPSLPDCAAGVIFFNNTGYLNMCGHGTIGVAVTLGHLGRIGPGVHRLETPVGVVAVEFDGRNTVTLENVPSYRYLHDVALEVEGHGTVKGDVAWGGNWFFLAQDHGQVLDARNASHLVRFCLAIRQALERQRITGAEEAQIDHIELVGPARDPGASARNFVLCPGAAYDRSPCGTGTSAKLACLHAEGKLAPGQIWRQESSLGTVFEGWYRLHDGQVIPSIRGTAHVIAESTLLIDRQDPLWMGFRP
jgi:4-hydroxyproline epimerase